MLTFIFQTSSMPGGRFLCCCRGRACPFFLPFLCLCSFRGMANYQNYDRRYYSITASQHHSIRASEHKKIITVPPSVARVFLNFVFRLSFFICVSSPLRPHPHLGAAFPSLVHYPIILSHSERNSVASSSYEPLIITNPG